MSSTAVHRICLPSDDAQTLQFIASGIADVQRAAVLGDVGEIGVDLDPLQVAALGMTGEDALRRRLRWASLPPFLLRSVLSGAAGRPEETRAG